MGKIFDYWTYNKMNFKNDILFDFQIVNDVRLMMLKTEFIKSYAMSCDR